MRVTGSRCWIQRTAGEMGRWALGRATSGQAVLADALQEFVPVPWKLQQKRLVDDPFRI